MWSKNFWSDEVKSCDVTNYQKLTRNNLSYQQLLTRFLTKFFFDRIAPLLPQEIVKSWKLFGEKKSWFWFLIKWIANWTLSQWMKFQKSSKSLRFGTEKQFVHWLLSFHDNEEIFSSSSYYFFKCKVIWNEIFSFTLSMSVGISCEFGVSSKLSKVSKIKAPRNFDLFPDKCIGMRYSWTKWRLPNPPWEMNEI